jgi:hypothetical protein
MTPIKLPKDYYEGQSKRVILEGAVEKSGILSYPPLRTGMSED